MQILEACAARTITVDEACHWLAAEEYERTREAQRRRQRSERIVGVVVAVLAVALLTARLWP